MAQGGGNARPSGSLEEARGCAGDTCVGLNRDLEQDRRLGHGDSPSVTNCRDRRESWRSLVPLGRVYEHSKGERGSHQGKVRSQMGEAAAGADRKGPSLRSRDERRAGSSTPRVLLGRAPLLRQG